jgi:hypothetical protein
LARRQPVLPCPPRVGHRPTAATAPPVTRTITAGSVVAVTPRDHATCGLATTRPIHPHANPIGGSRLRAPGHGSPIKAGEFLLGYLTRPGRPPPMPQPEALAETAPTRRSASSTRTRPASAPSSKRAAAPRKTGGWWPPRWSGASGRERRWRPSATTPSFGPTLSATTPSPYADDPKGLQRFVTTETASTSSSPASGGCNGSPKASEGPVQSRPSPTVYDSRRTSASSPGRTPPTGPAAKVQAKTLTSGCEPG